MIAEFRVCQIFSMTNGSTGVSIDVKPEEKIDVLEVDISDESKKQLWDFCKGDWKNEKLATVEFDGYYSDGYTPINPVVKHVYYNEN